MSFRFRTGAIDIAQPINRGSALNTGLVSWWLAVNQGPFYGGPRFMDLAGLNHGTLTNGPAWQGALGRMGGYGSIYFNGFNNYVNIPYNANMDVGTGAFSLCAWCNYAGVQTNDAILSSNWSDGAELRLSGTGATAKIYTEIGGSSGIMGATDVGTNVWFHVGLTRDASGNVKLWLNGNQDASGSTSNDMGGGNNAFNIGARLGSTLWWDGNIDDCRFYNVEANMPAIYQDSIRGYPQTLNWIRRVTVDVPAAGAPPATTYNYLTLLGVGA